MNGSHSPERPENSGRIRAAAVLRGGISNLSFICGTFKERVVSAIASRAIPRIPWRRVTILMGEACMAMMHARDPVRETQSTR
jgi:hypothetical protein